MGSRPTVHLLSSGVVLCVRARIFWCLCCVLRCAGFVMSRCAAKKHVNEREWNNINFIVFPLPHGSSPGPHNSAGPLTIVSYSQFRQNAMYLSITALYIAYTEGAEIEHFQTLAYFIAAVNLVDSTSAIMKAVFSCHILASSSFKSVYFWCFSVMVLWRLWLRNCYICWVWCSGSCVEYNYVWLIVVDTLLLWTLRSVIMNLS